jgi:hypothetical protein
VDPQSIPHFTLLNGILHYKNRVWIGDNGPLQHQLLESVHASAVGGAFRVPCHLQGDETALCLEGYEN